MAAQLKSRITLVGKVLNSGERLDLRSKVLVCAPGLCMNTRKIRRPSLTGGIHLSGVEREGVDNDGAQNGSVVDYVGQ